MTNAPGGAPAEQVSLARTLVLDLVAGLALVVGALSIYAEARSFGDEPERGCADVGFGTQTSGVTPDDAMSAYVRSQGGDPTDWASGGDLLEHAYHPRTADAEPAGYSEIGMLEITAGVWRAAGGCVN